MTIKTSIVDVEPAYNSLHEIVRATFHVKDVDMPLVAFGDAAQKVAHFPFDKTVEITATGEVTLLNQERALLVDHAVLAAS